MSEGLGGIFTISASGMSATRLQMDVVAENLANADSTAEVPGGDPYRRKLVTFRNALDRELEVDTVRVKKIYNDRSQLTSKYDPKSLPTSMTVRPSASGGRGTRARRRPRAT